MASFDPSPGQPNDPNYLNYSRSVEGPKLEGNTSGAQLTKMAGDTITDVAGAVDTSIKRGIQNTVEDRVDKERDQFTAGLQKVKSQLDNGQIAPPIRGGVATPGQTGSLVLDASQDAPEVPAGLEAGLSRIQQLSLAKASGSAKINDTQYAGNVLSIAKQLRSQYGSGYREYIDDTISKASGLPVANSYYQNLMLDINRQMMQLGKSKDDVGQQMIWGMHEGVPNMATFMNQRATQDPKYPGDAAMLKKINDFTTLKANLGIQAQQRAESKDDRGTQIDAENKNLTKNLNDLVAHHIEDNLHLSGMKDFRSVLNTFSDAQANPGKYSSTEMQALIPQLTAYRNYIYQQAHQQNLGSAPIVGGKAYEDAINTALAPIDTYIKLASDKETGPAFYALRQAAAIKEDDTRDWLISKDKGAASRQLMTARGILGEQGFQFYLPNMVAQGADKPFAGLFEQEALAAVAPVYDEKGQIHSRSMVDAVQHAKTKKDIPPEYYGKMTGWLEQMANPDMPAIAKDNMVKWAFAKPGLTDELNMEYRDPNTHQIVPGKYRGFNLMTSDSIVKSVAETAKAHPENYKMMQNWTETEFGKLYRTDIQNLNKTFQNPELKFHMSYDDTTKQFGLVDSKNVPITRDSRFNVINPNPAFHTPEYKSYVNDTLDVLDRMNEGTQHLRKVYEHNPQGAPNTDKYILQTLQTAGLRPGETMVGASAEMAKALIKTVKPEATPEEINKLLLAH